MAAGADYFFSKIDEFEMIAQVLRNMSRSKSHNRRGE
jgi:hypothetical protein